MNKLVAAEHKQPVSLRDVVTALLTWVAADALAGLAILATAAAVLSRSGHTDLQHAAVLLATDFTFVVTTMAVSCLVALTILWRLSKRSKLPAFATFFPPVPTRVLIWAVGSGIAVMAAELALESTLKYGLGIPLPIAQAEATINPRSWMQLGFAIGALAFVAPFLEEVLFRGYIFSWLRRIAPLWLAVTGSAALFAAVHGLYLVRGGFSGWFGTAEIFVIGVLLAWWTVRSNSLRPAYVTHLVINAVSFVATFLFPGFYP